ncbi:MAG: JAB domain-containing protein [Mariprofundus sp.]|nr:JAB domain-containing protein [Mariprofundus sp.]
MSPLSEGEINQLSKKRRDKKILSYFSFNGNEFDVCKDFKKRMSPNGKFYQLDESLKDFPSVAAALLKHKKHEWIIVAFEKNKKVDLIWINKGISREYVSLNLSVDHLVQIACDTKHSSVLIFHNHPNPNPNDYDCSNPSEQDIKSAIFFAEGLNSKGINLVEFICERGIHHKYFSSEASVFFPLREFYNEIQMINGTSKFQNFFLHMERIF